MPNDFKQVIPQQENKNNYRLASSKNYINNLMQKESYEDQIQSMAKKMAADHPEETEEQLRNRAIHELQRKFLGKYVSAKYTVENQSEEELIQGLSFEHFVIEQNKRESLYGRIDRDKNLGKKGNNAFYKHVNEEGATNRKESKRISKIKTAADKYKEANQASAAVYDNDILKQAMQTLKSLDLRREGMRYAAEAKSYNEADEQLRKAQADLKIAGAESALIRYTLSMLERENQLDRNNKKIKKLIEKQQKCDALFQDALQRQKLYQPLATMDEKLKVPKYNKSGEPLSKKYTKTSAKIDHYITDKFLETRKLIDTPENKEVMEQVKGHFSEVTRPRGTHFMFFQGDKAFDQRMMQALRDSVAPENVGKPAEGVFALFDELLEGFVNTKLTYDYTNPEYLKAHIEDLRKWFYLSTTLGFLRPGGDILQGDSTYDYEKHLKEKYGEKGFELLHQKTEKMAQFVAALKMSIAPKMGLKLEHATNLLRLDVDVEKEQRLPSANSTRVYSEAEQPEVKLEDIFQIEKLEACNAITMNQVKEISNLQLARERTYQALAEQEKKELQQKVDQIAAGYQEPIQEAQKKVNEYDAEYDASKKALKQARQDGNEKLIRYNNDAVNNAQNNMVNAQKRLKELTAKQAGLMTIAQTELSSKQEAKALKDRLAKNSPLKPALEKYTEYQELFVTNDQDLMKALEGYAMLSEAYTENENRLSDEDKMQVHALITCRGEYLKSEIERCVNDCPMLKYMSSYDQNLLNLPQTMEEYQEYPIVHRYRVTSKARNLVGNTKTTIGTQGLIGQGLKKYYNIERPSGDIRNVQIYTTYFLNQETFEFEDTEENIKKATDAYYKCASGSSKERCKAEAEHIKNFDQMLNKITKELVEKSGAKFENGKMLTPPVTINDENALEYKKFMRAQGYLLIHGATIGHIGKGERANYVLGDGNYTDEDLKAAMGSIQKELARISYNISVFNSILQVSGDNYMEINGMLPGTGAYVNTIQYKGTRNTPVKARNELFKAMQETNGAELMAAYQKCQEVGMLED